jgi:hypothetical protein
MAGEGKKKGSEGKRESVSRSVLRERAGSVLTFLCLYFGTQMKKVLFWSATKNRNEKV